MAGESSSKSKSPLKTNGQVYNPDYFTWPNPILMFIIAFSLWLLAAATVSPANIPTFLGPVGAFGRFMGTSYPGLCLFLSIGTALIHVGEAVYAAKVCRDRKMTTVATVKWVFSTFLFGFTSLTLRLLPYKPTKKTQ